MRTLTHSASGKAKGQGRYDSIMDAIQQKQADLINVLTGADLTSLSIDGKSSVEQPMRNNVCDVPYEEVK